MKIRLISHPSNNNLRRGALHFSQEDVKCCIYYYGASGNLPQESALFPSFLLEHWEETMVSILDHRVTSKMKQLSKDSGSKTQKLWSLVTVGLHTNSGLPPCRLLLHVRTKKPKLSTLFTLLLIVLLSFVANPHPRSCFSYKTRKLLEGRNKCVHFCLPQGTPHSTYRTMSSLNLCEKRSRI